MKTGKIISIVTALALSATFGRAQSKTVIRFGHFPNITHAQGVIAHALSRQGKGWFEERLGPGVEIHVSRVKIYAEAGFAVYNNMTGNQLVAKELYKVSFSVGL